MAQHVKKHTYLAPGSLGKSQGQGLKSNFLLRFASKIHTPSLAQEEQTVSASKTDALVLGSTSSRNYRKHGTSASHIRKLDFNISSPGSPIMSPQQLIHLAANVSLEQANSSANVDQVEHGGAKDNNFTETTISECVLGTKDPNMAQAEHAADAIENNVIDTSLPESSQVTKKRTMRLDAKPCSVNKCRKVASLKDGQKLEVEFFHNRPVGDNYKDITRHMGKLVRDRTVCSVRVHKWDEIDNGSKVHMWQSVLNKFTGKGIELDRHRTLEHMRRLWQNWRGLLYQAIKANGGLEKALEMRTPNDLTTEDWEWLVKEHYSSAKFQDVSLRNSENKGTQSMPHRTGSKLFAQVIWNDLGARDGSSPSIADIFKETRKTKVGILNQEEEAKYVEISTTEDEIPSLSQFEVVEKCFGPQNRDHVVCFGSGVRPKHVRGPLPDRADLTSILRQKEKENVNLRKRIDEMQAEMMQERETNNRTLGEMDSKLNKCMAFMEQSCGAAHDNVAKTVNQATTTISHDNICDPADLLASWTNEELDS